MNLTFSHVLAAVILAVLFSSSDVCRAQQAGNERSAQARQPSADGQQPSTGQPGRRRGGDQGRSDQGRSGRGSGGGGGRSEGPSVLDETYLRTRLPAGVRYVSEVVYKTVDGQPLKLDLLLPANNNTTRSPVALWIHGGAWMRGNKARDLQRFDQLAARILEQGLAFVSIEYRLSGQATFPAQIVDCNDARAFLHQHRDQYNLDTESMFVMGTSAGGHLASLVGTSDAANVAAFSSDPNQPQGKILGIVDFYGPADLLKLQDKRDPADADTDRSPEARLLGHSPRKRPDLAAAASPTHYVDKHSPPFLIFHGDQDSRVPLNQSEQLDQRLRSHGVPSKLVVVEGAGHGDQKFDDTRYNDDVMQFIRKQLAEAKPAPPTGN